MKKIWDISQTIDSKTPVWPNCPGFKSQSITRIDDNTVVNTSNYSIFSHLGTHVDAPLHYHAKGDSIDTMPLNVGIGPCSVLDLTHCKKVIAVEDIVNSPIPCFERVVFKTYDQFPTDQWDDQFCTIDQEVIEFLAGQGCIMVGTDTPSIDPQESKELDAHKSALRNNVWILEGLMLDDIQEGLYNIAALPLKIQNGDASPVRAALWR